MKEITWAELVNECTQAIYKAAAKPDADNWDKAILNEVLKESQTNFNTVSLARIATALYKLAGLEDNISEEMYEELMYDESEDS